MKKILIVIASLVLAAPCLAQSRKPVPPSPETTKNVVYVINGVVAGIIVVKKDATPEEWAKFLPEGVEESFEEKGAAVHPFDRYIGGKIMRQIKVPRDDGWQELRFVDVNNMPADILAESPEAMKRPWERTPTFEREITAPMFQALEARINELEKAQKGNRP